MILSFRASVPSTNRHEGFWARGKGRRGTACVEFAVLAAFLGMLILGMIECSRTVMVKNILSDAARRGCRIGILPGKATSDVTTSVTYNLSQQGIDTTQVQTTVKVNGQTADASTAKEKNQVSVTVGIPSSAVSWVSPHFISGTTLISEAVVMMRQ